jgi:hypothetical protein
VVAATAVVASAADRPQKSRKSSAAPVRAPEGGILYDQTGSQSGNGIASQDFETAYDAYDAQGADDFVVPAPGWSVNEVFAPGSYSVAGPVTNMNVQFFANAGGIPGALVPGCNYLNVPATADGVGNVTVPLVPPCALVPGTYWVSAQARMDFVPAGQWFWNGVTVQANTGGVWQNPGGGFPGGCQTWMPTPTCIAGADVDQAFALSGVDLPVELQDFKIE